MSARSRRVVAFVASSFMLSLAGCARKAPVAKVAPPPPPAPTAALAASPHDLRWGQSASLTWTTHNANQITISGVGPVAAGGSMSVRPQTSTTYTLTAKGPGGDAVSSARVTVALPPPLSHAQPTDEELFSDNIHDIFFNYNQSSVPSQQERSLKSDAQFLAAYPYMKLVISGHCDERGSEDYNLALGDTRADTVRDQLVLLGIAPDRIRTISYGKEQPFCTQETETCWGMNRRAHFKLQP